MPLPDAAKRMLQWAGFEPPPRSSFSPDSSATIVLSSPLESSANLSKSSVTRFLATAITYESFARLV